jgi:hypothetical protein
MGITQISLRETQRILRLDKYNGTVRNRTAWTPQTTRITRFTNQQSAALWPWLIRALRTVHWVRLSPAIISLRCSTTRLPGRVRDKDTTNLSDSYSAALRADIDPRAYGGRREALHDTRFQRDRCDKDKSS